MFTLLSLLIFVALIWAASSSPVFYTHPQPSKDKQYRYGRMDRWLHGQMFVHNINRPEVSSMFPHMDVEIVLPFSDVSTFSAHEVLVV